MIDMVLISASAVASEEEQDIDIMVIVIITNRRILVRYDEHNADEVMLNVICLVTSTSKATLNLFSLLLLELIFRVF